MDKDWKNYLGFSKEQRSLLVFSTYCMFYAITLIYILLSAFLTKWILLFTAVYLPNLIALFLIYIYFDPTTTEG